MASFKLFVALLCACVAASQVQAKGMPASTRTLGDVIENLIKVADILIKAIQGGIAEADPILDAINDELNPDLGDFIVEIRDLVKGIVNDVVTRVQFLEGEVTEALTNILGNIQECLDAAVITVDPILDDAESQFGAVARKIQSDVRADVDDFFTNFKSFTDLINGATDKAIKDSEACVAPGSPDVGDCVYNSTSEYFGALAQGLVDLHFLHGQYNFIALAVLDGWSNGGPPIIDATKENLKEPLKEFGICVTNLALH